MAVSTKDQHSHFKPEINDLSLKLQNENKFFLGVGDRNTMYADINFVGKRFILWLISYELNFSTEKIDYYFRLAKRLQALFYLPGWLLLLPNPPYLTKKSLRRSIFIQVNIFKSELSHHSVKLSKNQAYVLNKAYKNFLWE